MKKVWSAPKAVAEQFVPNEYVAACWGIACAVAPGHDGFGKDTNDGHQVGTGVCGNIESQYVQNLGNDQYQLSENNRDYGMMQCTIYPEGFDYDTHTVNGSGQTTITITNKDIQDNNGVFTLYWTTTWKDNIWYHYGTVNLTGHSVQHS